jgi:hypothetical protein
MVSINSNFALSRLNNPEFTALFVNVQKAINTATPENLGIDEMYPAYNAKLQELIDRVYVSQGSEFTAAMKAADDRRCLIFRRIRLRLQMVEVAEQNEALLACQEVVRTHLLTKYVANVTSRAYQERTSILKGFVLDLNEKLDEDAIEALGLANDIAALESANNAFIAAYAQRTAEKAEGNQGVTQRLRDEMFDLYLQLTCIVQYLANSTDTANAEKATACQGFIAHVNVLLSDAKKRLEQRLSNGDDGEGAGTDVNEGGSNGGDSGANDGSTGDTGNNGGGASNGGSNAGDGGNAGNGGSNSGGTSNGGSSNGSNPSNPSNPSEGGNPSNPSEGGNPSDGSDPNKPNGEGTVSDGEITF